MTDMVLAEEMEGEGEVEGQWTQAEITDEDLKGILYSDGDDNEHQ